MADYLLYWRGYWDDMGNVQPATIVEIGHGWFTKNESLYRKVKSGDNLWVVVSGGPQHPDEWRLLQCIRVDIANPKPQQSQYGSFHIVGDKRVSRLYLLKGQPDFSDTLRKFQFVTAKPIKAEGKLIGQSIQSPRELTQEDVVLMEIYCKQLKIDRGR